MRSSNGSLIDTNGCVALLVLSGFAVATINFEKRIPDLPAIIGMILIIAGVLIINLFSKMTVH